MVGFQTRLKWGDQKRILQMIPGLENAEFVRMGSMHRNTFIDSPQVLDPHLRLRSDPRIRIAGQLTGVEGYVESSAMGQWAGLSAVAQLREIADLPVPPPETAFGRLDSCNHHRSAARPFRADEHQFWTSPSAGAFGAR